MIARWIRRVIYGAAALYFFYVTVEGVRSAGMTSQALFPALAGVVFGVMAIFGKGG